MSLSIPEHYIRTFEKNWNHTVQQEVSRLEDKVMVKAFEGKEDVLTDLDQVDFKETKGRLGKSNPGEASGSKRKITKRNFDCQIIFDKDDKHFLGMLSEPTSELMEEMKFAWNRRTDQLIIEAASADVYGGVAPYTTPIALPSTQKVAVNYVEPGTSVANSGLTPDKLLEAKRIFEQNEIMFEEDEIYLVCSPKDIKDLTYHVKNAGNDTWAAMVADYVKDNSNKLFDFNVIKSNRLSVSSDIETAITFSKRRGICMSPSEMSIQVDVLPTQKHARQISAYGQYGGIRRYEEGVVEIHCDHSP